MNPLGDFGRAEFILGTRVRYKSRKEMYGMLEQLLSRENLLEALKRVEANENGRAN